MAGNTEQELFRIWTKPGYEKYLRQALSKLYEPRTSEKYLNEWTDILFKAAYLAWTDGDSKLPHTPGDPIDGMTSFMDKCIENGVVVAILRVIRDSTAKLARFNAMLAWFHLLNSVETHPSILEAHENLSCLCAEVLMKSLNSTLSVERSQAVQASRMWAGTHLSKEINNKDIAPMISACLAYTSSGYELVIKDRKNKQTAWQFAFLKSASGETCSMKDIPRMWAVTRDGALETVLKLLLSRNSFTQRRDCLEILKHEPNIFSSLLAMIGHLDRPHDYQESNSDATACEILSFFLSAPSAWFPELSSSSSPSSPICQSPNESAEYNQLRAECEASIEIQKKFVRERSWRTTLIRKWNRLEQESLKEIVVKVQSAHKEGNLFYGRREVLKRIYDHRARCRISILRVLVNLTHYDTANVPLVPANLLMEFLLIAYGACAKVPSKVRALSSKRYSKKTIGQREYFLRLEKLTSVSRLGPTEKEEDSRDSNFYIPSEDVLGPVLLLRLITRVHEKYGNDILSWTSLMPEMTLSNENLGRIQQITSDEIVNLVIQNAVWKRIPYHKALGTSHLDLSEQDFIDEDAARQEYLAAVELALAIVRYSQQVDTRNCEWRNLIPVAQRELVACLGNISLMSAKLEQWHLSWWYAKDALDHLEKIDSAQAKSSGWDIELMRKKNQDRLALAAKVLLDNKSRSDKHFE